MLVPACTTMASPFELPPPESLQAETLQAGTATDADTDTKKRARGKEGAGTRDRLRQKEEGSRKDIKDDPKRRERQDKRLLGESKAKDKEEKGEGVAVAAVSRRRGRSSRHGGCRKK